jgi:2-hydroxy-6-oxonona-2,4-dienedioate hydrolase
MESIWLRVGGRLVHARVADRPTRPAAPAVVCIHGLMVSGRYMVPLAERLAGDFRVYVPDLPGFGRSQPPAGRLTIAGLADAAAAWMDAMGLDRAALVGNSLGCQVVAASLGRRHPQRLTRAALIGPTVDAAGRSTAEQLRRLLLDMLREPPSSFPLLARDALDAGLRRPLATWAAALDDRLEANVAGLAAPVLVLRGARDPIAPQRWAAAVAG